MLTIKIEHRYDRSLAGNQPKQIRERKRFFIRKLVEELAEKLNKDPEDKYVYYDEKEYSIHAALFIPELNMLAQDDPRQSSLTRKHNRLQRFIIKLFRL